jgi:O-antigen ligase
MMTTLSPRQLHPMVKWSAILIGFSVPLSVVLDNVFLAVILVGAFFCFPDILNIIKTHPIARAALLLFSVLLLGLFYGATPIKDAFVILMKYVDLLFVPIFVLAFTQAKTQRLARLAFIAAMSVTLLLSYLVGFEILPIQSWMAEGTLVTNPAIFHSHITQNNFMAFAIFLALLEWREAASSVQRWVWASFAVLASVNVLFMLQGRTGYLILALLLAWFSWTTFSRYLVKQGKTVGWQHGAGVLAFLCLIFTGIYKTSHTLHDRVDKVATETQAWSSSPARSEKTSSGERLDFYTNSLKIVSDHWLNGVGTGGFPQAFANKVTGTEVTITNNPHNEYLMISVQTGVIGLACLLYLFVTIWRYAPRLSNAFEQDAARGLVLAFGLNCLVNSALHDHADGLFFALMTGLLFANLKIGAQHD